MSVSSFAAEGIVSAVIEGHAEEQVMGVVDDQRAPFVSMPSRTRRLAIQ